MLWLLCAGRGTGLPGSGLGPSSTHQQGSCCSSGFCAFPSSGGTAASFFAGLTPPAWWISLRWPWSVAPGLFFETSVRQPPRARSPCRLPPNPSQAAPRPRSRPKPPASAPNCAATPALLKMLASKAWVAPGLTPRRRPSQPQPGHAPCLPPSVPPQDALRTLRARHRRPHLPGWNEFTPAFRAGAGRGLGRAIRNFGMGAVADSLCLQDVQHDNFLFFFFFRTQPRYELSNNFAVGLSKRLPEQNVCGTMAINNRNVWQIRQGHLLGGYQ